MQEELRPEEPPALDQLVIRDLTRSTQGLDLVHARDLLAREPLPHPPVLLGEDVERAERVDRHHAEQSLRVRDEQVQRQVAAPRVADRPRALDLARVEHGERVVHVRLDRVRPADRRREHAALRVAHRREQPFELERARPQVVGDRRPAVQQKRGRAVGRRAAHERAVADPDLERLFAHERTLGLRCRRWAASAT